jgi:hypothetical protein
MHNIHCEEKQLLGNHIIKPKGVYSTRKMSKIRNAYKIVSEN